MSGNLDKSILYPLQEAVLIRLQSMKDAQFDTAKLCGGTALSRCWLHHRVSFDLDFFLPYGFNAMNISMAMKSAGIKYETSDIVDDPRKANQLHGYVLLDGNRLKVSFIEDSYFELLPSIDMRFGEAIVKTEGIAGLYHRKLRTISGPNSSGESFEGGRQKARDLFDLHVLSEVHMSIRDFMQSLPYEFPSDAFDNGIASMPWFEIMDELSEIACDPKWKEATEVAYLQNSLFQQIGGLIVDDDDAPIDSNELREGRG